MSFQQGLSGLNAAAKQLDVIGHNVANANTAGFKGSIAQFGDVFANAVAGASGSQIGIGTSLTAVLPVFGQGNITVSVNPLDMAINGQGFFRVSTGGTISYTRNGQFSLDREGYLVTPAGGRLTGYPADASGTIVASTPTELRISTAALAPAATTEARIELNLDSRATPIAAAFDPDDTSTYHSATSIAVYDSLGNAHALTAYFVKTAPNNWDVYAALNGTPVGAAAIGTLAFAPDGSIDTGATSLPFALAAPITTGALSPLAFGLDFSGSTQFGSPFGVSALTQDGYPAGKLTGYAISSDGVILGRYSNGQTRAQGQIVLANFANPQGLQPMGNNQWGETSASGQPVVGTPNSGNLGVVQSGALEESTVDITEELVKMITAQRIYQANAQTIKTQDAVLQTMVNLR